MDSKLDIEAIARELDEVRAAALDAYYRRDLKAYRVLFTDDLRYLQPSGRAIGLERLMRDVRRQFSQFKTVDFAYRRESLAINDDGTVTEVRRLEGTYSVSILFFFTRTWKIDRHGRYTFRRTDRGWQICEVEVLSETVKSGSRVSEDG